MQNLVAGGHTIQRSTQKWIPRVPPSRSLKVIEDDTFRSNTYDFVLVINSNYERILCRFRDKWLYLYRNADFAPQ